MKRASISPLALGMFLLVTILPSLAQTPKSAGIFISVVERSEVDPKVRPFSKVGLFKLLLGDTQFAKAQCPSRSNAKGATACRVLCDPDDPTELTLVLRPPGSDAVPGYEIPVSHEVTLTGCKLSDPQVTFSYTPLALALAETLNADPELRQAVAMSAPTVTFASLKPFVESEQPLAALIEQKPDNPNVARYARILHDASATNTPVISGATALKVRTLSVGTQSIYINAAAKRSLGPEKASQIAPITMDAARLNAVTRNLTRALDQKKEKSPSEVLLHNELVRSHAVDVGVPANLPPKIEWSKVNRATAINPGK